jgi:YrbI family 3-deoxy-D-manno-octulosonate 8-phosphate phosphatase
MKFSFNNLRFIVFDFDGVFTDNRVIVSEQGFESVTCNRGDGMGITKLRKIGIDMMILSTETVPVVQVRAKKLKLECIHGCDDKLKQLHIILQAKGYKLEETAFVGNDINDLDCLKVVGFPVCVNDAYPEVKEACKLILSRNGGDAAVREFCDMIYESRKHELDK